MASQKNSKWKNKAERKKRKEIKEIGVMYVMILTVAHDEVNRGYKW